MALQDDESQMLQILGNQTVGTYTWRGCTVEVQDRATGQPRRLLDGVSGQIKAGQLLALMGPSGSGKTTLLNVLAKRKLEGTYEVTGSTLVDGHDVSAAVFRDIASLVEQEDVLIGSLTVRETIDISARLARNRLGNRRDRELLVNQLLRAFGLTSCAHTLIGTPVRKGVSGGQRRRTSVASQLVTAPSILFLDEPTSGLDSTASREVMTFISRIAKQLSLLVVVCIHQPSTDTFNLFDKLLVLSEGKTCYFGPVPQLINYLGGLGINMPLYINPAEFILDLVHTDFDVTRDSGEQSKARLLQDAWAKRDTDEGFPTNVSCSMQDLKVSEERTHKISSNTTQKTSFVSTILPLLHRTLIKSYRDVFTYGVRYAMYTGLAILMGTVWLRLHPEQAYIQPYINAIFFASAFMSFMAVAYVPAFLEDRAVFVKDRQNGLYGPLVFMVVNFLIGLPYLFGISVLFSVITYWLINFTSGATTFFTWVMWLFLDLLAAESLVVFIASLAPNFVVALALIAFINGLWMSVGGFLIQIPLLNVFWKYVFHYIDYQAYVFQGMMVNNFKNATFSCGSEQCIYPTEGLQKQIPGTSVLATYGYNPDKQGEWVGILISIIVAYRLLGWAALWWRET